MRWCIITLFLPVLDKPQINVDFSDIDVEFNPLTLLSCLCLLYMWMIF